MRSRVLVAAAMLCALPATGEPRRSSPVLEIDHLVVYSQPGAPERSVLAQAGFVISPDVNHHDGQGTSSITVEFANGYLELLYPDPEVSVSDRLRALAQLFRDRSNWRTTGVSPLAVQFRRTPSTPTSFPFPTMKVHSDWMAPGQTLEMLTPRELRNAIGLLVTPDPVSEADNAAMAADPVKGKRFLHPNGARRITGVEIVAPSPADLPPAARYLATAGAAKFRVGAKWQMIVTLDGGKQGRVRDFDPVLPLIARY